MCNGLILTALQDKKKNTIHLGKISQDEFNDTCKSHVLLLNNSLSTGLQSFPSYLLFSDTLHKTHQQCYLFK